MIDKEKKQAKLQVKLSFKLPIYTFIILLTLKGLALCKLLPEDGISWLLVFLLPIGIALGIIIFGIIIMFNVYMRQDDYL